MTTKVPTDWESIEKAYRVGQLAIRAIAEKYDSNHATILKRAKKEGWTRDLTDQVRTATKQKLSVPLVTNDGNRLPLVTEAQMIDEASDFAASVVLSHRVGLSNWRQIAGRLCTALNAMDISKENLGDFSRALNAGVDAQLKVIKGERQAYNLDESEKTSVGKTLTELMQEIADEA